MQFRLENPIALWGLLLVVGLAGLMFWNAKKHPESFSWRRLLMTALAFSLCTFAMSRPQWGQRVTTAHGVRTNLFFAIDISRSMTAQDVTPSRLEFAIAFAQKLLQRMNGVKVAVFPFAADGYMMLPLTTDLLAASDMISPLTPTMTTNQGTDLTQVLRTLFTHIMKMETAAKERGDDWMPSQVVLLTDGETHRPLKSDILSEFRAKRIPIHTVGIGTTSGIQLVVEGRFGLGRESMRDNDGRTVITKMYPDVLKKISSETGGDFFSSRFEEVYRLSSRVEQAAQLGKLSSTFKLEKEYFPLLFALALFIFFIELGLGRWEYALRSLLLFAVFSGLAHAEPVEEIVDKRSPEVRATEAYNNGVKAAGKNPQKAAELFQDSASTTQNPEMKKKSLFNLGNALVKLQDPVQALQAYQMALDVKAGKFDKVGNQRISENILIAMKLMEQMKQNSKGDESQEQNEKDGKQKQDDPKGPKTDYKAQSFSDQEKQKIYDLLSSDEQQTMQRLQEQRNRGQARKMNDKPW